MIHWAYSVILLVQISLWWLVLGANLPESEIAALSDMYQSTDGIAWNWHGSGNEWNFSNPNPCTDSWNGITCTTVPSQGYLHVTKIQLERFGLKGTLPASIGNFSKLNVLQILENPLLIGTIPNSVGRLVTLTTLDLESNHLTGSIPASLGQLTQLTELYLNSNELTGTIPDSIGQMMQLIALNLYANRLSGPLPASLGQLPNLQLVYVYSNQLTGIIPDSLGQLEHLSTLYLHTNHLTGSMPAPLCNCRRLVQIDFDTNLLTGTIPESIGQLTLLTRLFLFGNQLTGSIPDSLSECVHLSLLGLYDNLLTGTIPDRVASLPALRDLDLFSCLFTGTIPDSLGNATALEQLLLFDNMLTGVIPVSLGQCIHLQVLELSVNQLTGPIPASLGQLTQLTELLLYSNLLTGTLPATLAQCTKLGQINLSGNQLTGTLPSALSQLTALVVLYTTNNHLSGTIPSTFSELSSLAVLYLSSNRITGTLPASLAQLSPTLTTLFVDHNLLSGSLPNLFGASSTANQMGNALEILFCDDNRLTGTIPDATAERLQVLQLSLGNNHLTGSIPSSLISAMHSINFLFLENNQLSGTLPADWSAAAHSLSYLYLQSNHLSGPIPASLGHIPVLQTLNLSYNRLSSTIPTSLQLLWDLRVLILQHNHLSGNIDDVVSPCLQTNLSTVQLSGNQLTGTLPAVLFQLPSLSSLTAVDNCLDGPLPVEAICQSASLSALVLDGLHSASACKRGVSLSHRPFKLGTLPACLLSMSSLATLHLSGNGMTGSVPPLASDVLTDLSLSHNLLTGEIPDSILDRDWDKLDLSYNRLTGALRSARAAPYGNSTALYLQHNRLSGEIPGSMQRVGSLSLLEDNMFSCRVDHSDLPQQDLDSDRYTCGSDAVNSALYAWLGTACVVGAVAAVLVLRRSQTLDTARTWMRAVTAEAGLSHLYDTFRSAEALVVLAAGSAAYCTLLLLPVYAGASNAYPTFTYKYAWTISGAYLSGTVAFALEAVFLLLQLPLVSYAAQWLLGREQTTSASISVPTVTEAATDNRPTPQSSLGSVGIIALSLCVVTGINVAFVIATLRLSGRVLTVIQILLAVFKLAYNSFVVPTLQRRVKTAVTGVDTFRLLLVLVNVIVIPCIVVLLISPACYYDALKGSDAVTSNYEYSGDCLTFTVVTNRQTGSQTLSCDGVETAVDSTSYTPAFAYSYQCSSSFVTYYAPTFVIMCVITGFVVPVTDKLLVWLGRALPPTSWLRSMVLAATASILRELPSAKDLASRRADPLYRPVFDASRLLLSLLTYLALLLTFGALFPPLAVCCAVAMLSLLWTARLEVGRYVSSALVTGRQDCLEELDSACRGGATGQQVRRAVYLILSVSCLFYTLFLFDTLGDAVGFAEAVWVLIVVPLLPVLARAGHYLFDRRARLSARTTTTSAAAGEDPEAGVALEDLSGATAERKQTGANPMHGK